MCMNAVGGMGPAGFVRSADSGKILDDANLDSAHLDRAYPKR